jgi:hypothetical protein
MAKYSCTPGQSRAALLNAQALDGVQKERFPKINA